MDELEGYWDIVRTLSKMGLIETSMFILDPFTELIFMPHRTEFNLTHEKRITNLQREWNGRRTSYDVALKVKSIGKFTLQSSGNKTRN